MSVKGGIVDDGSKSRDDIVKWIDSVIDGVGDKKTSVVCNNVNADSNAGALTVSCSNKKNLNRNYQLTNSEKFISQYFCVYQSTMKVTGAAGAVFPETKSTTKKPSCVSHNTCVSNMVMLQALCTGHKAKASDCRGMNDSFPAIVKGRTITPEFYNQLVTVLQWQINERKKSPKYSVMYNKDEVKMLLNKPKILTSNDITGKQATMIYSTQIGAVLGALSCLQSNNEYDTNPAGEKFKILKNIQYTIAGSGDVKRTNDDSDNHKYWPSMVLSKENIGYIVQALKQDLNDCICYSDCNSYSVCYCYGNCQHY